MVIWASDLVLVVKNPPASAEVARDVGLIPGSGRSPRNTHYSSILAGKFHGQRSLAGYSQWGYKESNTTEQLRTAQWLFVIYYRNA